MTSLSTRAPRTRPTTDQAAAALRTAVSGSRGGCNRRRILRALVGRPRNANRLAEALALDYKTVRHHLAVLEEIEAVSRSNDNYGSVYVPTAMTRQNWDIVEAADDAGRFVFEAADDAG